jgi:hypothetical protein
MVLSHGLVRLTTSVALLRTQKVKAEWTFLTADICKSRCEDQTVMYTHVLPHSGSRWHRHSNSHVTIGLAVLF